jgi:hypothetical protein
VNKNHHPRHNDHHEKSFFLCLSVSRNGIHSVGVFLMDFYENWSFAHLKNMEKRRKNSGGSTENFLIIKMRDFFSRFPHTIASVIMV